MKNIISLLGAFAIITTACQAQTKQERPVNGFTSIKAESAIQVIVTMGDKESLYFESDEETLPKLQAEVRSGCLRIYTNKNIKGDHKLIAHVSAKMLNGLSASGAADIELSNTLNCDKLRLEASGAGNIKAQVNAKEIDAEATGAGNIKVSGVVHKLKAEATGAGNLKAGELKSETAEVNASGAGTVRVNVSQSLDAEASGAGSIIYSGDPKSKNINVSTAGSVKKA